MLLPPIHIPRVLGPLCSCPYSNPTRILLHGDTRLLLHGDTRPLLHGDTRPLAGRPAPPGSASESREGGFQNIEERDKSSHSKQ